MEVRRLGRRLGSRLNRCLCLRLRRGGRLSGGTVAVVARGGAVGAHVGWRAAALARLGEPCAVVGDVLEIRSGEYGARGAARRCGLEHSKNSTVEWGSTQQT